MRKSGELIAEVSNQAISYNLCFISYVRLFDPVVCSAHNSKPCHLMLSKKIFDHYHDWINSMVC